MGKVKTSKFRIFYADGVSGPNFSASAARQRSCLARVDWPGTDSGTRRVTRRAWTRGPSEGSRVWNRLVTHDLHGLGITARQGGKPCGTISPHGRHGGPALMEVRSTAPGPAAVARARREVGDAGAACSWCSLLFAEPWDARATPSRCYLKKATSRKRTTASTSPNESTPTKTMSARSTMVAMVEVRDD